MNLLKRFYRWWGWREEKKTTEQGKPKCWRCNTPFSDWFVWSNGQRYCFVCWFCPSRLHCHAERALILDETDAIEGDGSCN